MILTAVLNKSKMGKSHPISRVFLYFDGYRHAQMGHSVESRRTDPCLGFLLRQGARFHDVADNALVALHDQLNMAA